MTNTPHSTIRTHEELLGFKPTIETEGQEDISNLATEHEDNLIIKVRRGDVPRLRLKETPLKIKRGVQDLHRPSN